MKISSLKNRKASTALESKIQKKKNPGSRMSEYDYATSRFHIAAMLFIFAWAFIWFRAFYIQLIEGPSLAERAGKQHSYTEIVEAKRGTIYDRNGQALARSIEARSIYANPRAMSNPNESAKLLAPYVQVSEERLRELFSRDKAFVWVQRKVDDNTAKQVLDAKIEGIGFSREYDRIYPQKHLAGQLLGFVGIDNTGLEGVERSFDEELRGEASRRIIYKDGDGRRYYMDGNDVPTGKNITLTIDAAVQYIAEEVIGKAVSEYNGKWGGILIAEVETGEVIAWAQYPHFNPNDFRNSSPIIYKNRIASDALEPGSTIKSFPIAAALEENIITPETTYFAENGIWKTEYITIRDDGRSFQDLNATEIMKESSNIAVAKIGLDLGIDKYHHYLTELGFGLRTQVGIAENKGIVRAPNEWTEVDLMAASFGQSIAVTGLQMAQAYLTLANNGIFKQIKVIKDENKEEAEEKRVFSAETTAEILKMLREVVSEGTGARAKIENVSVAGKTGTAQKASITNNAGYGDERFASFVGIVPADAPKYVVLVMIDEPQTSQYGGVIAAPAFKEVATRVLAFNGYISDIYAENSDDKIKKEATQNLFQTKKMDKTEKLETFPNLIGASLRSSLDVLIPNGITPEIRGKGLSVLYQYPAPGTALPLVNEKGQAIPAVIWLSREENEELKNEEEIENKDLPTQANAQLKNLSSSSNILN